MPAWDEYKSIAKERGALALELYVVESTPATEPTVLQSVLPEHLAYQKQMEADGKLFLAGPLSDDTGTLMEGRGLIIYRASSMDEAEEIAKNDPMHAKGARTYSVRKWLVNEGSPRFTTSLSDQSVTFS